MTVTQGRARTANKRVVIKWSHSSGEKDRRVERRLWELMLAFDRELGEELFPLILRAQAGKQRKPGMLTVASVVLTKPHLQHGFYCCLVNVSRYLTNSLVTNISLFLLCQCCEQCRQEQLFQSPMASIRKPHHMGQIWPAAHVCK